MDISEYEVMKENKRLLEESLKNERSLQEQIKKLSDEKTKALEDASMKVVKVTKHTKEEVLMSKRLDNSYALREVFEMFGLHYNFHHGIPRGIDYKRLADIFFEKITVVSVPHEEITTHGLDEIKKEIRDELKASMDQETKDRLENAAKLEIKNAELVKLNLDLSAENHSILSGRKALVDRIDELEKINEGHLKTIDKHGSKLIEIDTILASGYDFWNKKSLLDRIIKVIK